MKSQCFYCKPFTGTVCEKKIIFFWKLISTKILKFTDVCMMDMYYIIWWLGNTKITIIISKQVKKN